MTEKNINSKTIALIVSIMGIFNGCGRLVFSAFSDKLNKRITIYKIILALSIVTSIVTKLHTNTITIAISLIIISACYGAGFSCLPTLLSDIYDMKYISRIHGLSLTAWAIAGLVGNQISSITKNITGSYNNVYVIIFAMYIIAFTITFFIKMDKQKVEV
jgi:OFA family oxalate/formate antiporter-like MFS transporter